MKNIPEGVKPATDFSGLLTAAQEARENAYAPYSHFCVGAALLCGSGTVYTGCNIENAAYSPSNCAERTAFFKAVSEGEREFAAIAVVGGPEKEAGGYVTPCGVCRQVMMEFTDPDTFKIVLQHHTGQEVHTLSELLPGGFGPASLRTGQQERQGAADRARPDK